MVVDSEWIDKTIHMKYMSIDERALLRFYRFWKKHREFLLGVIITLVVVLFVMK